MLNLDNIKDSDYISEEGTYTLVIDGVDISTTLNDNVCHNFHCHDEETGLKISCPFYFTEKALFRYKKFIKMFDSTLCGDIDEDTVSNSLIGKTFIADVKRKKPRVNIVTGDTEESKFFEIVSFRV